MTTARQSLRSEWNNFQTITEMHTNYIRHEACSSLILGKVIIFENWIKTAQKAIVTDQLSTRTHVFTKLRLLLPALGKLPVAAAFLFCLAVAARREWLSDEQHTYWRVWRRTLSRTCLHQSRRVDDVVQRQNATVRLEATAERDAVFCVP